MEAIQFPFMPAQQKAVSAVEDSDCVNDDDALDRLSGRGQKYNNYGWELRLFCAVHSTVVVACRSGLGPREIHIDSRFYSAILPHRSTDFLPET